MKIWKLVTAFFVLVHCAHAQDFWIQRDSVKGPPKSACVGFSLMGVGYIGTGFDDSEKKRSLYNYIPFDDDWDQCESMGGLSGSGLERSSAVAFVVEPYAYVGLGQGFNPYFNDFWRYDPATDTWMQVANFGGDGRTQAVAFGIGEYGYAGTGLTSSGLTNDFWRYDVGNNSWSPAATFPGTARRLAVGFTMGSKGYVGTGDDGTPKKDFYMYDPVSDSWTQKADFGGTPRSGATGFGMFPRAFLGTGYDNTLSYKKDFWEYNYWNDTWTQRTDFPGTARSGAASFAIGNSGYVGTGYDGILLDDFYEYFPAPVSVNEQEGELLNVRVFPNPAQDKMQITLHDRHDHATLNVFDLNGKCVYQQKVGAVHGSLQITVDCKHWKTGTYILRLDLIDQRHEQTKVIVHHS